MTTDGRVWSESALVDAYDHANEFLAEDVTLHNLTNIERATCHSLVGMYRTIRDLQRQVSELTEERDAYKAALEWYGDIDNWQYDDRMVVEAGDHARDTLSAIRSETKHAPRQEDET